MTIIYCDICGKELKRGDAGCRVLISEYRAEACDDCAKRLINYVKGRPWATAAESNSAARAFWPDCPYGYHLDSGGA